MNQNNTLLLLGALALLGSRAKTNGAKYPAKVIWDGWCDNSIDLGIIGGRQCYDWDYKVIVQRPFVIVDSNGNIVQDQGVLIRQYTSSRALGYDYDAGNFSSYESVLNATMDYAEQQAQSFDGTPVPTDEGYSWKMIPGSDIDWITEETPGFKQAQEGFDFSNYKEEIKMYVKLYICYNYGLCV